MVDENKMPIAPMDPLRGQVSRELALPQAATVLLAAKDVAHCIDTALRPYTLRIESIPGGVRLAGDSVAVTLAEKAIERLGELLREDGHIALHTVESALHDIISYALRHDLSFRLEGIPHPLRPLSLSQVAFVNSILFGVYPLTFGVGPTGTGKTHLALAAGLTLLARDCVQKVVITRPHILWEGEIMTAPRRADIVDEGQLTPIEDELNALIGHESARRLKSEGRLEIVRLGCLRGRTFNGSVILVDDAQNILIPQMRMLLTRLGRNSRFIITGDSQETDLHGLELSGLQHVLTMVSGRDFAWIHRFEQSEIIRNPVVAEIEGLYARQDQTQRRIASAVFRTDRAALERSR
jgi:phosphate starvation-inducible protein PhoH and related proteins